MYYTPPLFPLGKVVATSTVAGSIPQAYLLQCLRRHMQGDWGCVCKEDAQTNKEAAAEGLRILSAYPIDRNQDIRRFWRQHALDYHGG